MESLRDNMKAESIGMRVNLILGKIAMLQEDPDYARLYIRKMIEKELDKSMFKLIKELRGGWNANYWSAAAGMFGHKLKKGYIPGQDPVLDAVLNDLDISYQISRK